MNTTQQAAVLTLQNSVGCSTSNGVGNYKFYFPELSEQLTDEEIEELLSDEQIQQTAGVVVCDFCDKYEYSVDTYQAGLYDDKCMCYDCWGGC